MFVFWLTQEELGSHLWVVLAGSTGQERNRGYWPEARAQSGKAALSLAPLPCPSLLFAISHDHGEGMKTDSGSG